MFLAPFASLSRSLADSTGKTIDFAKFESHFALEGADWFPRRLHVVFLSAQESLGGTPKGDKLTLEGFREGGGEALCW